MGPFDALWFAAAISLATPILFAAMGELVAERAGIFNIGLEGMMLVGAFAAFVTAWLTGNMWLGILVALAAGALLAAIMAALTIEANADQVVVGVSLNIVAFGVTTFAFKEVFSSRPQILLEPMRRLTIPGLSDLSQVGSAVFEQVPLTYLAYLIVPVVWFLLYKTNWGLALRAAGEMPGAVDTAGVNVRRVRWAATLVAGALAGVGGSFLSIVSLGLFVQGMSAGRGFIALAAVIFGAWRPFGVLGACLVFGAVDALQLRLQTEEFVPRQVWFVMAAAAILFVVHGLRGRRMGRNWGDLAIGVAMSAGGIVLFVFPPSLSLPSQVWLALPYVLPLLVLAGLVGRARMPTALGINLRDGE